MNRLIEIIQRNNDIEYIKKKLDEFHVYDIANVLPELEPEDRKKIYSIYNDEELANIFSYLDDKDASDMFYELNDVRKAAVINEMEPDDITDVLQETDEEDKDNLLNLIDKDLRDDVIELTKYDESSAGAIMTTHYITAPVNQDIKLAMKNLIANAPDVESINTIFVVDENEKLYGIVELKELIIAKSPCIINDIMNTNYKYANTNSKIEEVVRTITDYDIYDLPIVENGILKGIITMDDAIDNMVDQASDDYAKLAGLTTDEEKDETTKESIKKRIPWLLILLILDFFVPIISSMFDFLFSKTALSVLIIFQPVILGLAGNSGMQSLGISIRSISNKSIETKKNTIIYILKEIFLGLCIGLIMGLLCFAFTYLMLLITNISEYPVKISMTVAISTTSGLIISSIIGSIIPIIIYKLKGDPAVASGPLITTIIDVTSTLIYFSVATVLIFNTIN